MKQHRTTRSRAAVCLLFSIGLGSCESHSPTGGIAGRGTLAIRSDVSALVPEGSAQLHTVLRVGSSDNEVTAGVTWSSSDPLIVAVSSTGLVRGVAPGTAIVHAASQGQTADFSFSIRNGGFLADGGAVVAQQSAVVLSVPAGGLASNVSVFVDVASGAPAVGTGTATITATAGSASASKTITIPVPAPVAKVEVYAWDPLLHVGGTGSIGCTPYDAAKGIPTGTTATWSSSNTSVATIKGDPDNLYNTGGYVTAVAPGSAVMTCTIQGKTASTTITVMP